MRDLTQAEFEEVAGGFWPIAVAALIVGAGMAIREKGKHDHDRDCPEMND